MTPVDPDGTVDMPSAAPARKVVAGTVGAAVAGFLLWLLSKYVFDGDTPEPVQALVALGVPALLTFAAGYLTKRKASELDTPVG